MMETVVREQMMDVVARRVGLDPLKLRRLNVVNEADLPFTTAAGMVYDSVSIGASLERPTWSTTRRSGRTRRAPVTGAASSVSGWVGTSSRRA
jgi:carbon-monoxide dehydrogenase large subunit